MAIADAGVSVYERHKMAVHAVAGVMLVSAFLGLYMWQYVRHNLDAATIYPGIGDGNDQVALIQNDPGQINDLAIAALIEAACSYSGRERMQANAALEQLGEVAVPNLINALTTQGARGQRMVVGFLRETGDKRAIAPLLRALFEGTIEEAVAVEALLELEGLPLYYYQNRAYMQVFSSEEGGYIQEAFYIPGAGEKLRDVQVIKTSLQEPCPFVIRAEYNMSYDPNDRGCVRAIVEISNPSVDDGRLELTAKLVDKSGRERRIKLQNGGKSVALEIDKVTSYLDDLIRTEYSKRELPQKVLAGGGAYRFNANNDSLDSGVKNREFTLSQEWLYIIVEKEAVGFVPGKRFGVYSNDPGAKYMRWGIAVPIPGTDEARLYLTLTVSSGMLWPEAHEHWAFGLWRKTFPSLHFLTFPLTRQGLSLYL